MSGRRLAEDLADDAVRLHGQGLKPALIAQRIRASQSTITRILVRHGLITTRRHTKVTPGMVTEMVRMHVADTPIRAIAASLGSSYGSVRWHLERAGIEWRYLIGGKRVHAMVLTGAGHLSAESECGLWPGGVTAWRGAGSGREVDRAAALPRCRNCLAQIERRAR
jgi:DNA invertase Pin-like site-specific DNA recombinase